MNTLKRWHEVIEQGNPSRWMTSSLRIASFFPVVHTHRSGQGAYHALPYRRDAGAEQGFPLRKGSRDSRPTRCWSLPVISTGLRSTG